MGQGCPDDVAEVRRSYDAVAERYASEFGGELAQKPLDRALLAAFVELAAGEGNPGLVADLGCGPGHVTRYLADLGCPVVGVDLSPGMVSVARGRYPDLDFEVGSMLDLPVVDGGWAGVVALYSIIHLDASGRAAAYREFARATRPGGWLLLSVHVSDQEHGPGGVKHVTEWWGEQVSLRAYFLDPDEVATALGSAGFVLAARLERQPHMAHEYPSRRCYLLASRA